MFTKHTKGEAIPNGFVLYKGFYILVEIFNQLNLIRNLNPMANFSAGTNYGIMGLQKRLKLGTFSGYMDKSEDAWLSNIKFYLDFFKKNRTCRYSGQCLH